MTMIERAKPVHFEPRHGNAPCGVDLRMGSRIVFTTNQIGEITCRKCLAKMRARAFGRAAAALGEDKP